MSWLADLFTGGRAATPFRSRSVSGPNGFDALFDEGWGARVASGVRVTERTAMQISAVYACVTYIAQDIAKLDCSIFRGSRKGASTEAQDHALYALLRRPAPWLTGFEFRGMLQASVLLRGNGYAAIVRDGRNNPIRLFPIHPDLVTLCEAVDGSLFYRINRSGQLQGAMLGQGQLYIPAEDMLHLKPLTMDGLTGLSVLSMERETLGLALAQAQLAQLWTGNGAQPRGILTTDGKLTPEIKAQTREAWQAMQGGLANAGRTAVLEAGLKWQALSISSQDMEFLASRKYSDLEIYRLFRMPMHMGGEAGGSKGSVVQNAQEYLTYTISTHTTMWEQQLELKFDVPDGMFVKFDEDVLTRADIQTRYAANRISLGGQAWKTVNEIRADDGLPPIEGGDVLFRPVNMAPLDSDEFEANPSDPNAPAAGSEQTGQGADGGGRPKADGTPAVAQKVKR